jgi:hypothetical protein
MNTTHLGIVMGAPLFMVMTPAHALEFQSIWKFARDPGGK